MHILIRTACEKALVPSGWSWVTATLRKWEKLYFNVNNIKIMLMLIPEYNLCVSCQHGTVFYLLLQRFFPAGFFLLWCIWHITYQFQVYNTIICICMYCKMSTTLSLWVRCHHGSLFWNIPVDVFFWKMILLANEDLNVRVFVILSLIFFLLSIFSGIAWKKWEWARQPKDKTCFYWRC